MTNTFDIKSFDVPAFDKILAKGLSTGLGIPGGQVCIEAAICQTLGLPHSDDPGCVSASVRAYKIRLNDSSWSSPAARAAGLRDLGLAQLGSKGVVDNIEFCSRLATETIRVLLPALIREIFPQNAKLLSLAEACVENPSEANARAVQKAAPTTAYAAYAAYVSTAAANAAYAAATAATANAAYAATAYVAATAATAANAYVAATAKAAYAAATAADAAGDKYLLMSAAIALQILKDLKSPGCELL